LLTNEFDINLKEQTDGSLRYYYSNQDYAEFYPKVYFENKIVGKKTHGDGSIVLINKVRYDILLSR